MGVVFLRSHKEEMYYLCLLILLLGMFQVDNVCSKPSMDQLGGMSDAIQYLNDLDQYYSTQMRPSGSNYKRSGSLSLIGDSLSGNSRPRFGKRSMRGGLPISMSNVNYD